MSVEIPQGTTRIFEALPPQAQGCIKDLLYQVLEATDGKFIAVVPGNHRDDINLRLVFERKVQARVAFRIIEEYAIQEEFVSHGRVSYTRINCDTEWDFVNEDGYRQEEPYPSLILQLTSGLTVTVSVAGPEIWHKIKRQGLLPSYGVLYRWPLEDKVVSD